MKTNSLIKTKDVSDIKALLISMLSDVDNNPVRFSSTLKNKKELREKIDDIIPHDMKMLEKVYNIVNDNINPYCKTGNKKSFGGFKNGYSDFCGRGDVCSCYVESLTKNYEFFGPIDIQDVKKHIEEICAKNPSKPSLNFKKNDSIELAYLKFLTPQCCEDATIAERLYAYKNPSTPTTCDNGKYYLFDSYPNGYRKYCFTTTSCLCKSEVVSTQMKILNEKNKNNMIYNQKQTFYNKLISKLELQNLEANFTIDEYNGVYHYYSFTCITCNNVFDDYIYDGHVPKCKVCNPPSSNSKEQDEVYNWLKTVYSGNIIVNDRTTLPYDKEIDIYLPELNLGIEYNGVWYHSEQFKNSINSPFDPSSHKRKQTLAKNVDVNLITIFSDEWRLKQSIVKRTILSQIGLDKNYIHARKCYIRKPKWSEIEEFINTNHIQGAGRPSKYNYALMYDDEIVAVMTFMKHSNGYEILRFCSNTRVNGGGSKLLQYFIKDQQPSFIFTYSNRRYGSGELYNKLGFIYKYTTKQNYFWINKNNYQRLSREKCQKQNLVKQGHDPAKTENQIMESLGYVKVYDCGHDYYEMNLDNENGE